LHGNAVLRFAVKGIKHQQEAPFQGSHEKVDNVGNDLYVENIVVAVNEVTYFIVLLSYIPVYGRHFPAIICPYQ